MTLVEMRIHSGSIICGYTFPETGNTVYSSMRYYLDSGYASVKDAAEFLLPNDIAAQWHRSKVTRKTYEQSDDKTRVAIIS